MIPRPSRSASAHAAPWALAAALFGLVAWPRAGLSVVPEWPHTIESKHGKIVLYQPQLESLTENRMHARSAFMIDPSGEKASVFGAAWFDCKLLTDRDTRTAELVDVTVTEIKLPEASDEQIGKLRGFLEQEVESWEMVIPLDQLLASLEETEGRGKTDEGLRHEAPRVLYASEPTVLVLIDGEPKRQATDDKSVERVVNTVFLVLYETSKQAYYLQGGRLWYAAEEIEGPWKHEKSPPASVRKYAEKLVDAKSQAADSVYEGGDEPVQVWVSLTSAELIESAGEPEFAPVDSTQLLYVKNTESDLLLHIPSQQYYVLISGRWFTTRSLPDGPWSFVANDALPEDFARIPRDSDVASVRASVAGTPEAHEAVLDNSIPQTAEVDRKTASVEVKYDGEPKFEKVEGKEVYYATNTDKSVLLIREKYYCCDQAIWFVADGPSGPWVVCDKIPEEVYSLPPSCPVYNVKYVYVYDSTPDVVYIGYTPGYVGSYYYGGCVVYGTGWYYRPWYSPYYYYPRPVTYGFGVHYNSYSGWSFSFGVGVGGPYGWVGVSFGSPYYGGWWGPAGYPAGYWHGHAAGYHHGYYHGYHHGYHHGYQHGFAAGYVAGHHAGNNLYRRNENGVRRTGGETRDVANRAGRPSTQPAGGLGGAADRPGAKPAGATRPSQQPGNNNVYADRDGNVHRKTDSGWESRQGGTWKAEDRPGTQPASRPSSGAASTRPSQTTPQNRSHADLNRQAQSREYGQARAQNYSRPPQAQSRPQSQQRARPSSGGGRRR